MIIKLKDLKPNKLNANVMPLDVFEKLKSNIRYQKGRHPSIIVRKISDPPTEFDKKYTVGVSVSGYRIIDGHNRKKALTELGHAEAQCDVWEVDDKTELLLLSTLNELKGTQDLTRRGSLLQTIMDLGMSRVNQLKLIPEDNRRLDFVLSLVKKRDLSEITDVVARKNAEIENERQALREKFIKDDFDPKKAEAMADIYSFKKYVQEPEKKEEGKKVGYRPVLVLFFDTKEEYKIACDFFEVINDSEPKIKKLIELIKGK